MLYQEITYCRSCGSTEFESVLNLGLLQISDFINIGDEEDIAPLELVCCQDCSLVQLRHTVDRDRLYRSYYYRSGTNESMVDALRDVANEAWLRLPKLDHGSVLDIGANDGTLLKMFPTKWQRHGFEPSSLALNAPLGTRIVNDYFPPSRILVHSRYNVITSIACFYDVDDPNAFVSAVKDWLAVDGIWVCQFQDFHSMLAVRGFDNICHEHLTYWGQDAFQSLINRHGMHIEDIQHNDVNGGSVRYFIRRGQRDIVPMNTVRPDEFAQQLTAFSVAVKDLRAKTVELLGDLKASGKTVLGYGASTKGNTMLQYYGIGPELIPAIADRNPDKWGRLTVGSHILIISEAEMRHQKPDFLFIFPWHFLDSFRKREAEFLARGGQFIVPLPHLSIVGESSCQRIAAERYARV